MIGVPKLCEFKLICRPHAYLAPWWRWSAADNPDAFPAKLLEYHTLIDPFENLGFRTCALLRLHSGDPSRHALLLKSRSDQRAVNWLIVECMNWRECES